MLSPSRISQLAALEAHRSPWELCTPLAGLIPQGPLVFLVKLMFPFSLFLYSTSESPDTFPGLSLDILATHCFHPSQTKAEVDPAWCKPCVPCMPGMSQPCLRAAPACIPGCGREIPQGNAAVSPAASMVVIPHSTSSLPLLFKKKNEFSRNKNLGGEDLERERQNHYS